MRPSKKPILINITALGVVKIILILILFYFLYIIKDVLAILFISLVLASALNPWIDWLQNKKIPRGVSMFFIYILMFVTIFGIFSLAITPITEQVVELSESYPFVSEKISSGVDTLREFTSIENVWDKLFTSGESYPEFAQTAETVFSKITGIFGSIFTFFIILVITFYMAVEEGAMKKVIWSVTPKQHQISIMKLVNEMQKKVGLWLRGQLILSLIMFTLTYIGLSILGVEYALILALITGLTEFVPYLGPILAAIPAIFLAFTQKPILAIFVAILYYIIQIVENNIIVPIIMQKVVGLNPIISIAVLLIGFNIAGIVGTILAIPVATAVKVVVVYIFEKGTGGEEI